MGQAAGGHGPTEDVLCHHDTRRFFTRQPEFIILISVVDGIYFEGCFQFRKRLTFCGLKVLRIPPSLLFWSISG